MPSHQHHAALTSSISRLTKVAADMAAANGDDRGRLGPAIRDVVACALHMGGITTKSVKLITGRKYIKRKNTGSKTGGQKPVKKEDSDDDDCMTISECSGSSGCEDKHDEDYYSDTIYVQQRNPTAYAGTSAGDIKVPATHVNSPIGTNVQSAPQSYPISSRSPSISQYFKIDRTTPGPSRIPVTTQNPHANLGGDKKRKFTVDHDITRAKK